MLALAFAFLSSPAPAEEIMTGNLLWEFCGGNRGKDGANMCLAYVLGAADGIAGYARLLAKPPLYCLPSGGTRQQIVDVVTKRLADAPEQRSVSAITLIAHVLTVAFPCRR